MLARLIKNPMTRKRLSRFKEMKRAYISWWILVLLYLLSLGSELLCNSSPLYVRYQGQSYFPVFKFYSEDTFLGNQRFTRPDYHQLKNLPEFKDDPNNIMIFAPIPYGPYQSMDPGQIVSSDHVIVSFEKLLRVANVNIDRDFVIQRSNRFGSFVDVKDRAIKNRRLADFVTLPQALQKAVLQRFDDQESAPFRTNITTSDGTTITTSLSAYKKRNRLPKFVRVTFRDTIDNRKNDTDTLSLRFNRDLNIVSEIDDPRINEIWQILSPVRKQSVVTAVQQRYQGPVDSITMVIDQRNYRIEFKREEVRFPYPPVKGHFMGIDGAGRDVLARILYGLRTSMTFGLMLVLGSMALGIAAGALQGYYGGLLDITGQRFIEIWSALPFLYIMILMGSIYGRSFSLLLFCYGLFNWIGISYYMRAEFLRLRKQPFVEAAKCMGVRSYKIIFKHILPNGMVPVITFFPFSLVGAIGSLAALDYLGFGLPPPTPSWGELLYQAQQYRWAWWLILYPSLSLFVVMLLGVFVGEGIRNAYDPKRFTRLI